MGQIIMTIKFNSITIEIDKLDNDHGGKDAAYFALKQLLESQKDRTLENWDGQRLRDINGNSIGSVSVDWGDIDHFEDVASYYTVDNCRTCTSEDGDFNETLLVLEMSSGGYWWALECGSVVSFCHEAPTDNADMRSQCPDVDLFTLSNATIDDYEDLARHVYEFTE